MRVRQIEFTTAVSAKVKLDSVLNETREKKRDLPLNSRQEREGTLQQILNENPFLLLLLLLLLLFLGRTFGQKNTAFKEEKRRIE